MNIHLKYIAFKIEYDWIKYNVYVSPIDPSKTLWYVIYLSTKIYFKNPRKRFPARLSEKVKTKWNKLYKYYAEVLDHNQIDTSNLEVLKFALSDFLPPSLSWSDGHVCVWNGVGTKVVLFAMDSV